MVLCFGVYANILKKCSNKGVSNKKLVATLVSTIDTHNCYAEKGKDVSVYRLMNCEGNFPHTQVSATKGPIRETCGSITTIMDLVKNIKKEDDKAISDWEIKFDSVIELIDPDKKAAIVGALQEVIRRDESLRQEHSVSFYQCLGDTAENIVRRNVNFRSFLARLFLYIVFTNENTKGKEYIHQIINEDFVELHTLHNTSLISEAKKKYITDELKTRYILNRYRTEEEIEFFPSEFNIVSIYYITLCEIGSDNKYWEVMIPGSYHINSDGIFQYPSLSAPSTWCKINPPEIEITTVGKIKEFFNIILENQITHQQLNSMKKALFQSLGISNASLAIGRNYIEYNLKGKIAICNYVREFYVSAMDKSGLLSLYDEERMQHYIYLPLEVIKNGNTQYACMNLTEREVDTFTNYYEALRKNAVSINSSELIPQIKHGFMLKISINLTPMTGAIAYWLSESATDIAMASSQIIGNYLRDRLIENKISNFQVSYNQVLITLPEQCTMDKNTGEQIADLVYGLYGYLCASYKYLQIFNNSKRLISIRCTIIFCDYTYSKTCIDRLPEIRTVNINELDELHKTTCSLDTPDKIYGVWLGVKNDNYKLCLEDYTDQILLQDSKMTLYFKNIEGIHYKPGHYSQMTDIAIYCNIQKEMDTLDTSENNEAGGIGLIGAFAREAFLENGINRLTELSLLISQRLYEYLRARDEWRDSLKAALAAPLPKFDIAQWSK